GGTEYVSDFLIAGRDGNDLNTHHGDSGTLWLYEAADYDRKPPKLHPIALHWGQHVFSTRGESSRSRFAFGLATSLSNMCRVLNVDIVRGWNVDVPYTWGRVGHYTVAARAIDAIQDKGLGQLMKANQDNITFPASKINKALGRSGNPAVPTNPA